jgi:hypothetical protein
VQGEHREAYRLPPSVAFPPERVNAGVSGAKGGGAASRAPGGPSVSKSTARPPGEGRLRGSCSPAYLGQRSRAPGRWARGVGVGGRAHSVSECSRLPTEQRLLNAMALYRLVAWRIPSLTMAGRASPEGSCEVAFESRARHTRSTRPHHRPLPQAPPSLRGMGRGRAQRGGC